MRLRASIWAGVASAGALSGALAFAASPIEIKEGYLEEALALRRHRLSMTERRYGESILGDRALPTSARPLALDIRLDLRSGAVPRLLSARMDELPLVSRVPVAAALAGGPEWLTITIPSPPGARLLRVTLEWSEDGRVRSEEMFLPVLVQSQTDRMRLAVRLEERLRLDRLAETFP